MQCITYEMKRIGYPGVFCDRGIFKIDLVCARKECCILYQSASTDRIEYLGFFFFCKMYRFRITTPFEIEDVVICPGMFIITDQLTIWICAECGLTGSAQTEEDGRITILPHV